MSGHLNSRLLSFPRVRVNHQYSLTLLEEEKNESVQYDKDVNNGLCSTLNGSSRSFFFTSVFLLTICTIVEVD